MTTVYITAVPPIKNSAFTFYISLISQADPDIFQANPTLAAGDVKVSIDGGVAANITALPTVIATATKILVVTLTAAEMNGNRICVLFSDAAGAEWQDALVEIVTETAIGIEAAVGATPAVGTTLTLTIGVTYAATITGLTVPASWTKVYLTVKKKKAQADTDAVIQILKSNPADGDADGIKYLNAAAATVAQRAYGSLTVNQGAGTVAIAITDDGTLLLPGGDFTWDLKCLLSDGSSQVLSASGTCEIDYTETRSV